MSEFEESGIGEECGVFGCVAAGEWPTQLEVAKVLTLGLVALQHSADTFLQWRLNSISFVKVLCTTTFRLLLYTAVNWLL
ncbi:unnamed protein product [Oncorhynchus mykiss]|uniref:Glutamine amidotransferase type-2 domain-containing protein n=1 Tax=Oncorhynchus mykiss TaxID=8022 RepID=A0A060X9G1_ONCMY|nr:unnamed protein product [Oncorhynchus mykiss]